MKLPIVFSLEQRNVVVLTLSGVRFETSVKSQSEGENLIFLLCAALGLKITKTDFSEAKGEIE